MSLINPVSRRHFRTRILTFAIYLLLSIGSITMVVPFLLMTTMATTSEGDYREFRLIPKYWTDDRALFQKLVVDAGKIEVTASWGREDGWFSPVDVKSEQLGRYFELAPASREAIAKDYQEFLRTACPPRFKRPLYGSDPDNPFAAVVAYRRFLEEKYKTVEEVNQAYLDNATSWEDFVLPVEQPNRRPDPSRRVVEYREWVENLPPDRVTLFTNDADLLSYLRTIDVKPSPLMPTGANGKVILSQVSFDLFVSGAFSPEQVREFFTQKASLRFAKLDVEKAKTAWKSFLILARVPVPFPLTSTMPDSPEQAAIWAQFIQNSCPTEAIGMDRPEDAWREFLFKKYAVKSNISLEDPHRLEQISKAHGVTYKSAADLSIPHLVSLHDNFVKQKGEVRTRYLTHNFRTVFEFIAVHGDALKNTVLLIVLSIAGALTVNPMAAYALSRFRLKESHQVLVFLLATMAFPGEVLMIPSFLQIKSFPLAQVILAGFCMVGFFGLQRLLRKIPVIPRTFVSLTISLVVVVFLAPLVLKAIGVEPNVSLMNSFWALILPGLASGFGIFLLKGFFDSLPPELYEAGLLDGAGELLMFFKITLPLCKPILAVMALGSFTAAYGAFMHAFLVAQDPKMWTLMVFLYEFQQSHSIPMVMASLVISAIPTLIVFLLCQRVILQGIVIPTYK